MKFFVSFRGLLIFGFLIFGVLSLAGVFVFSFCCFFFSFYSLVFTDIRRRYHGEIGDGLAGVAAGGEEDDNAWLWREPE